MALTGSHSPSPSADQLEPSRFAMDRALTVPMAVNQPPEWSVGPLPSSKLVRENTGLFRPLLVAVQLEPSQLTKPFAATPAISKVPPMWSAGPLPASNA